MDVLLFTSIIVGGLAAFSAAALRWGVDTRPGLPDDHRRPAASR
jgi:hypothetical protein